MKKPVLVLALLLLAAFSLLLLPSCDFDEDTLSVGISTYENGSWFDESEYYDDDNTWGIYWYLCGSDLETDYACGTEDLEEMLEVTLPDNVWVVIQTGGAQEWHNDFVNDDQIGRYLYDSEGLHELETLPDANMGDSQTFEDFLRFCYDEYPADRMATILWNHGGGSIAGVAFDENHDDDALTLPDMHRAFDSVFELSDKAPPLEFIGFDACLMATIDVAYTFKDTARYLIASEELEPGCGWKYDGWLGALAAEPRMNGAMVGKAICDSFVEGCIEVGDYGELTLSVVDLSRIEPLLAAYDNMAKEALAAAIDNPEFFSVFGRNARTAESYGHNDRTNGYTNMVSFIDLAELSNEHLPETAGTVQAALEYCLAYRINGPYRQESGGLSGYYPYDMCTDNFNAFARLSPSKAKVFLYEYLITGVLSNEAAKFAETMSYTDIPEFAPSEQPQITVAGEMPQVLTIDTAELEDFPVYVDDEGYAVLDLGKDNTALLAGVYFQLCYFDIDDDIILLLGRDNNLYADWNNGVFKDNFTGEWGTIDGNLVYMELTDDCEDYVLYSVPILLNGKEYTLRVCYDIDEDEFIILGARKGIDENGKADKNLIKLKEGDSITTLIYASTFDDDDDPQLVEIDTFKVTSETSFYETDMGDGDFILMFEMTDSKNNYAFSDAVHLRYEDGEIYFE